MDTIDLSSEIEQIIEAKAAQGLTMRELSDISGVPQTTVQRIISRTAKNPSHQAISSLKAALGLLDGGEEVHMPDPGTEPPQQLIEVYQYELERQRKDYEARLREHRLAEGRLRHRALAYELITAFLVLVIILVLIYDAANGNIGFIRYVASAWDDTRNFFAGMA